jgi:hypothetical protein
LYGSLDGADHLCFGVVGLNRWPLPLDARYAFATQIKEVVNRAHDDTPEEYRANLIEYGNEERAKDPNVFAKNVEHMFKGFKSFTITDLRFINEWEHINMYAEKYGYDVRHVRVVGDGYDGSDTDPSEIEHLEIPYDATAHRFKPHCIVHIQSRILDMKYENDVVDVYIGSANNIKDEWWFRLYKDHCVVSNVATFNIAVIPDENVLWVGANSGAKMKPNIKNLYNTKEYHGCFKCDGFVTCEQEACFLH